MPALSQERTPMPDTINIEADLTLKYHGNANEKHYTNQNLLQVHFKSI